MQRLTEIAIEHAHGGIFSRAEVACWLGGSSHRQFGLLKRALASEEILHVRRGFYCLANRYLSEKVDPLLLAQRIYGPSYISLETALSYHGWIPEGVFTVTSTSLDRSREFTTPLGLFSFVRVPQGVFYTQVARQERRAGQSFLLAEPLKALVDYVYVHKHDWRSIRPVIESLRVEENLLSGVSSAAIGELMANYSSARVHRFLTSLRKDLNR